MNKQLVTLACVGAIFTVTVEAREGVPSPTPTASPSATASPSPSPSPSASPDDHGGGGTPTPTPSPSASPGGDDHGGDRKGHGGDHDDFSMHGLYEGTTATGGVILLYVDKNTQIQVNVLDVAGQTVGFAEGQLVNGAFSFTLSNGQSVTGTGGEHSITGTLNGAGFEAKRAPEFGEEHTAAGRFAGVAHGPDGESRVQFVIEANKHITLVQTSGTAPNFVRTGGFGTVTPPVAPSKTYTFVLDKFIGSTSAITGSFTVTDGLFAGTFTTSAGTFTVNSFKTSLANRMANISTRGLVGQGAEQLIGGFVIKGGPKMVLIRAVGPSLAAFGVSPVLTNPSIKLFGGQTLLASNDDWKTNANAADIMASTFAPTDDTEAALLVRLEPGSYTTAVTGANTGIGLVEIYEVGNDD